LRSSCWTPISAAGACWPWMWLQCSDSCSFPNLIALKY
jgi:hypothetical protein